MKWILTEGDDLIPISGPIVLALGAFDGIHIGHQAVIAAAKNRAQQLNAQSVVYSFHPHPSVVLNRPKALISIPKQKIDRLNLLAIDYFVEQHFTPTFAGTTAQNFMGLLQKKIPNLLGICFGENFRFGRAREGCSIFLQNSSFEFEIEVLKSVLFEGQCVSSSRIRECLVDGHVEVANQMLGYPYSISGTLQNGRGMARTLGYPTLNIHVENDILLKFGVYLVGYDFGKKHEYHWGIANFGIRPTFSENIADVCLEVHSFDPVGHHEPCGEIEVQFRSFIRKERYFSSSASLINQIQDDIKIAKKRMSYFVSANGDRFRTGTQ